MRTYYIHKIHPLNYPLAFICRLFGRVYYWKSVFVPKRGLFIFERLFFRGRDHYYQLAEENHKLVKNNFEMMKSSLFLTDDKSSDYEKQFVFERLIKELDSYLFFIGSIPKKDTQGWIFTSPLHYYLKDLIENKESSYCNICLGLDVVFIFIFNKIKKLAYIIRVLKSFYFSKNSTLEKRPYLITSLSPLDLNSADENKRSIFSFIKNLGLKNIKCSVYIDFHLTSDHKKLLKEANLQTVILFDCALYLDLKRKLLLLRDIAKSFFLLRHPLKESLRIDLELRGVFFTSILDKVDPHFLFSNNATINPETCEAYLCRDRQIKTIKWFFSGNEFGHTIELDSYNDRKIRGSLLISEEIWMWNKSNIELYQSRNFKSVSNFLNTGPLMAGDAKSISNFEELRKRYLISSNLFCISFFDNPIHTLDELMDSEFWPILVEDEYLASLQFLKKILTDFPDISLIYKPKKKHFLDRMNLHEEIRDFFIGGHEYIKRGQLILLPYDSDPYHAVGLADICLSPPFSSPLFAADYYSIPYLFIDPLNRANYTFNQYMQDKIVSDYSEIQIFIKDHLDLYKRGELRTMARRERSLEIPNISL